MTRAETAAGWRRWHVPSHACPRITDEYLAEEREARGDVAFRQEYLAEFVTDGINPINSQRFLENVADQSDDMDALSI